MVRAEPLLITIKEVALILGVCTKTVRNLADNGSIPRPIKLGKSIRWNRRDILEMVNAPQP